MQTQSKPSTVRKIISAGMPQNISAVEKEALEKKWNEAAKKREEDIARETRIPTEASATLSYQLKRFGKHWNAYSKDARGRWVALLNAPSLLTSAMDAITDKMSDEALRV